MSSREALFQAIFNTIKDIEHWRDVLSVISQITGISRGTIALRDYETGGLVVPSSVKARLDHPLLFGWTQEEVQSYINDYMEHDPWFEVERLHHPNKPYALSKHIDPYAIENGRFGEWLQPIGINDSVVAEIGLSPPFWVSMNLYFHADQHDVREKALATVTEFQQTMRDAWQLGDQMRSAEFGRSRLGFLLEKYPGAALLVDASGQILNVNGTATGILKSSGLIVESAGKLRFRNNEFKSQLKTIFARSLTVGAQSTSSKTPEVVWRNLRITLTPIDDIEDPIGADRGLRLLAFEDLTQYDPSNSRPLWENPLLTKRESELVKYMANGGRVADFVRDNGLKKSTGHYHWQNAKKKLQMADRAELIALHQVFLQNQ